MILDHHKFNLHFNLNKIEFAYLNSDVSVSYCCDYQENEATFYAGTFFFFRLSKNKKVTMLLRNKSKNKSKTAGCCASSTECSHHIHKTIHERQKLVS